MDPDPVGTLCQMNILFILSTNNPNYHVSKNCVVLPRFAFRTYRIANKRKFYIIYKIPVGKKNRYLETEKVNKFLL
jgi:hypothetical protein